MFSLKSLFATLSTYSFLAIQAVQAQGLVGPPVDTCYGGSGCRLEYLPPPTHSNTEYLPLATVLVTLAMGIFILRARREEPPNWLGAAKDLLLLFGIPALVYGLWTFVVQGRNL